MPQPVAKTSDPKVQKQWERKNREDIYRRNRLGLNQEDGNTTQAPESLMPEAPPTTMLPQSGVADGEGVQEQGEPTETDEDSDQEPQEGERKGQPTESQFARNLAKEKLEARLKQEGLALAKAAGSKIAAGGRALGAILMPILEGLLVALPWIILIALIIVIIVVIICAIIACKDDPVGCREYVTDPVFLKFIWNLIT
jgi:hypothetical protein